jgi:hypothetical protein
MRYARNSKQVPAPTIIRPRVFSFFDALLLVGASLPQLSEANLLRNIGGDIEPNTNAALVPVAMSLTPPHAPIAPDKFGVSGELSALLTSPAALIYSMVIAVNTLLTPAPKRYTGSGHRQQ